MSDNKKIVDVLIAIDSDTILQKYGSNYDPQNPIQITDPNLIYMITRQAHALSGQADSKNIMCVF